MGNNGGDAPYIKLINFHLACFSRYFKSLLSDDAFAHAQFTSKRTISFLQTLEEVQNYFSELHHNPKAYSIYVVHRLHKQPTTFEILDIYRTSRENPPLLRVSVTLFHTVCNKNTINLPVHISKTGFQNWHTHTHTLTWHTQNFNNLFNLLLIGWQLYYRVLITCKRQEARTYEKKSLLAGTVKDMA